MGTFNVGWLQSFLAQAISIPAKSLCMNIGNDHKEAVSKVQEAINQFNDYVCLWLDHEVANKTKWNQIRSHWLQWHVWQYYCPTVHFKQTGTVTYRQISWYGPRLKNKLESSHQLQKENYLYISKRLLVFWQMLITIALKSV